ncbi:MAG: helix-turn-helix domain-containing protein [Rhodospirillales bacterium]|nr:helix-turn-helix domain-containing protein [Rhodospirillales bacterium]
MTSIGKLEQIRHAAELYYEQGLSQQDITKILGCSHSTVSRLLAEARDLGIVQFTIERPVDHVPDLAIRLREVFGLRDAVVVRDAPSAKLALRAVSSAAASFLSSVLEDGLKVGITWGSTLAAMLDEMKPLGLSGVKVVQLSGALGDKDSSTDGPELAFRLARLLDGECHLIPAPALVEDRTVRDALANQPQIRAAIDFASDADIMIHSVGALSVEKSSLRRAGYLSKDERAAAQSMGAAGHVIARMIDIHGQEVGNFADRAIGVSLEATRNAAWSIAVSAAPEKVPAILGALRGGYFNAVVLDETSATEVLGQASLNLVDSKTA